MLGVQLHDHTYPISPEEAAFFGWVNIAGDTPTVMATRSPLGMRVIPTRELVDGEYRYGFVETRERPTYIELEPWEISFGSDDEPIAGLLM